MIRIAHETADAQGRIDTLLDRTFGRARLLKTAQRLRDGRLPAEGLTFIAHNDDDVLGTIRFWHVSVGTPRINALLLGPMAIEPSLQGQGVGSALISHGLHEAARLGHQAVILVGDHAYYGRFGFQPFFTQDMALPGPVDRKRFLGIELVPNALRGASGLVRPGGAPDPSWRGCLRAA